MIRTRLDHAGQTYDVAGLGNVFTFPPYRREGFGSRVVDAAAPDGEGDVGQHPGGPVGLANGPDL